MMMLEREIRLLNNKTQSIYIFFRIKDKKAGAKVGVNKEDPLCLMAKSRVNRLTCSASQLPLFERNKHVSIDFSIRHIDLFF